MSVLNLLLQADLSILFFINKQLANPILDFVFKSFHYLPYAFFGLLIFFFIFKEKNLIAMLMILTVVVSSITAATLKTIIDRERPYQVYDVRKLVEEDNNRSFPSNHVQLSVALSTIVFYFYRRFGLALFILSTLVGISRIYLGVHYLSDVLAGAVIGILLAIVILKLGIVYRRKP